MNKEKRSKSDLQDQKKRLKRLVGQLKQKQKSIDSHNISNYSSRRNQSGKVSSTDISIKSNDSQEYVTNTYKLLKHYYKLQGSNFFSKLRKYLSGEWQIHKKKYIQHLNRITYLQSSMQTKNKSQIQYEIIIQWRKNPILYHIRAFWYEHVLTQQYVCIGDFTKQYNLFKDFIGQLAYLYFQGFFSSQTPSKDTEQILDRLTDKTAHMIITHTTTWLKVCEKHVIPLLKLKLSFGDIGEVKLSKFTMQQLQIKTIAVDYMQESNQMPKTTDKIQKFISQYKTLQKIKLLGEIRQNMDEQIKKRLDDLKQKCIINKNRILDKDDFVDCLVYCAVKGNISLENLGVRSQVNVILSKFKSDPYLADLQAMYNYLLGFATKDNSLCEKNTMNSQDQSHD